MWILIHKWFKVNKHILFKFNLHITCYERLFLEYIFSLLNNKYEFTFPSPYRTVHIIYQGHKKYFCKY